MTNRISSDLLDRARKWRDTDSDTADIQTLSAWLSRIEAAAPTEPDIAAMALIEKFFRQPLTFGTAGLRGPMGPGPGGMNTRMVARAAQAIGTYLLNEQTRVVQVDAGTPSDSIVVPAPPLVVIGFDGRYKSRAFAHTSAAVLAQMGLIVEITTDVVPTPVLAFAIRDRGAAAGIMVTASHNPASDNGYKVYLDDGRQIISPVDEMIAGFIQNLPDPILTEPRHDPTDEESAGIVRALPDSTMTRYVDAAAKVVGAQSPRQLAIVHTALHGVSTRTFSRCLAAAGFATATEVAEQQWPDPAFPTVAFPNPEEPGAMDAALDLAAQVDADIVIAHDPDGDRCAIGVKDAGRWRMLSGDEVGGLIGWWLLERDPQRPGVFASSMVSGTLLPAIAQARGISYARTLTGFKWISRVPDLSYGYEEALGYCVDPQQVADKDGITAGLVIAELAATLRARGSTMTEILDELFRTVGVHLSSQVAVRVASATAARDLAHHITAQPPTQIGGLTVTSITDLSAGTPDLPPTLGLRFHLGDEATIYVRPSGTEPKVKAYLHVHLPPATDVISHRQRGAALMSTMTTGITRVIAAAGP